jgi:hypothetical protein
MGVFWSGTDTATIEEIGQNGLCVAVVFNKKKEMKGAVWLKGSELSPNLYFDDIPVEITHEGASNDTKALWAADFDAKCAAKVVPAYKVGEYMDAAKVGGVLNPMHMHADYFDLTEFEASLDDSSRHRLAILSNDLIYGFTIEAVDKALAEVLTIIKASKATKHEKKKAYKEYKEIALDQKNYLSDNEMRFNHA